MLPVPHHAWTLATGALRSSWTISVRPSGRTHFWAELGGKAMTAESSTAAAFKFTMLNTIAEISPATSTRYTNLLATVNSNEVAGPRQSRNFGRGQTLADFSFLFRSVRLHERLLKIVNGLEILDRILVGFSKNPGADEIEDHVTDIFAGTNSPVIEDRHHHRPEFLERVLPDAFEQLRSRDVPHGCAFCFFLLLGCEIERVAQKNVGLALITRVARHDRIEGFGKSNLLH